MFYPPGGGPVFQFPRPIPREIMDKRLEKAMPPGQIVNNPPPISAPQTQQPKPSAAPSAKPADTQSLAPAQKSNLMETALQNLAPVAFPPQRMKPFQKSEPYNSSSVPLPPPPPAVGPYHRLDSLPPHLRSFLPPGIGAESVLCFP